MDKVIAGIDLHGNNLVIGVIDEKGKRLNHRKLQCDLKEIVEFLQPFKPQLNPWPSNPRSTGTGWWTDCARTATLSTWPIQPGSSNTAASNMPMTSTTRFTSPNCSG